MIRASELVGSPFAIRLITTRQPLVRQCKKIAPTLITSYFVSKKCSATKGVDTLICPKTIPRPAQLMSLRYFICRVWLMPSKHEQKSYLLHFKHRENVLCR